MNKRRVLVLYPAEQVINQKSGLVTNLISLRENIGLVIMEFLKGKKTDLEKQLYNLANIKKVTISEI